MSILIAIVLAVAITISAYAFLNSATAKLEQKIDTEPIEHPRTENVTILASTFNGNVEVETTTNDTIEVTFRIQAPESHIDEIIGSIDKDLIASTSGNDILRGLNIQAHTSNATHGFIVNYKADIIIKLPTNSKYNLTLTTDNGNIIKPQLDNFAVTARTDNGNIDIRDGSANKIIAQSANGNINLGLAQGTLFQANAISGNGKVTHEGVAMDTSIENQTHLTGSSSGGPGNLGITLSVGNGNISLYYFS